MHLLDRRDWIPRDGQSYRGEGARRMSRLVSNVIRLIGISLNADLGIPGSETRAVEALS
jgi:hypothetical protein